MPDSDASIVAELRRLPLFDGITDTQLSDLLDSSEVVAYSRGQVLFAGPAPADHWWVNLEGTVDFVVVVGGEEMVYAQFVGPGRWAGGHRAWEDGGIYLGEARATSAGRVLKVPSSALHDLLVSLPLVPHVIDGLVRSVRSVVATIREREGVLSLGSLSAGLAHELNNPAAAASRAASSLASAVGDVLSFTDRIADGTLSMDQVVAVSALRREIGSPLVLPDALALSDREDQLSSWLADHGVDRGWLIGPMLARHGLDIGWCERLADSLGGEALQAALDWISSALSAAALVDELEVSTRRVSELVSAVKSYSQMDRAARQRIDVTEGIESTLLVLADKLGEVTVVRRYSAEVPQIEAIPGELNQVWTNIVDNAVEAMDGRGTLTVSTWVEDRDVVVEIKDDGVGMTPEVAARAFDAFFTTKNLGAGTGLGLDIARRIVVQRHGGTISIQGQPDGTALRVGLPVRPS